MSIGLIFWLLMLIAIVFHVLYHYQPGTLGTFGPFGGSLFIFILIFLLGWGVFGAPIHG